MSRQLRDAFISTIRETVNHANAICAPVEGGSQSLHIHDCLCANSRLRTGVVPATIEMFDKDCAADGM
jgi:hypothetical protein